MKKYIIFLAALVSQLAWVPLTALAKPSDSCDLMPYYNPAIGVNLDYFVYWGNPKENEQDQNMVAFGESDSNYLVDNQGADFLVINKVDKLIEKASQSKMFTIKEYADALASNPDYQQTNVRVGGREAIMTTRAQKMEYAHGSGIAYSGPSKDYKITDVFTTTSDGKLLHFYYGLPLGETETCPFEAVLKSLRFAQ